MALLMTLLMNNTHWPQTKPLPTFLMALKLSLVVVGICSYSPSINAHSVHHEHDKSPEKKSQNRTTGHQQQIDTLVKRYSLSGDDALLAQGWSLLKPNLTSNNLTPHDLLQAAWLSQAEHKFDTALIYIDKALQKHPRNVQAWLLRASIYTVQGNAAAARHACQQVSLDVSPVVAIACSSRLANTQLEKQQAFDRLKPLIKLPLDPDLKAWVNSIAADLARDSNQTEHADTLYRLSIKHFPSIQVRAAYADLLLSQARNEEVMHMIDSHEKTPALAVRRLLAAHASGLDIHQELNRLDQLFRSWAKNNDFRHAREMAMFYLELGNDPQLAYKLATENIKIQQEAEDIQILQKAQAQASGVSS